MVITKHFTFKGNIIKNNFLAKLSTKPDRQTTGYRNLKSIQK